jgi:hypothetical protein
MVIVVYSVAAVFFYILTLVTFDDCLGRITKGARRCRPRLLRPHCSSLATPS